MLRVLKILSATACLALVAPGPPARAQAAREWVVIMDNMNFGKLPSGARVGDVIVWDNRDTVVHSATARDRSFDVRLQPGKKGRTVLKTAGTIAIYCIYHPMMRGTLKVAAR